MLAAFLLSAAFGFGPSGSSAEAVLVLQFIPCVVVFLIPVLAVNHSFFNVANIVSAESPEGKETVLSGEEPLAQVCNSQSNLIGAQPNKYLCQLPLVCLLSAVLCS